MEQLGSYWTDFHEIWCLHIFRKHVEKTGVSLKSDNNNGYFKWRPKHIFDHISLSSNNENVSDKHCAENRSAHFILVTFFFFEKHAGYEIMWRNLEQPDRSQMTIWRTRITFREPKGYKHALGICNIYCFPNANLIAPTRLNVNVMRTLPILLTYSKCTSWRRVKKWRYGSTHLFAINFPNW